MTAKDAFLKKGEELKEEAAAKQEEVAQTAELAKSSLDMVRDNSELADMYRESATVGAENLSGESPLLKVHTQGKSKNKLSDGRSPQDGYFFYKPTGEEFETIRCHVLTISRGFRAPGLEDENKLIFNQILAGVIMDGAEMKPFLMYMTGKKLQPLWDFGKEASKYTKARPVPIPMFALTVKLSTKQEANKFGDSWIVQFEIEHNEGGYPEIITDPEEFTFLKEKVADVQDTINSIIANRSDKTEEEDDEIFQVTEDVPEPTEGEAVDSVEPDDIPF